MWKQKISISLGNRYTEKTEDIISVVKKAGFDGEIFWTDDLHLLPFDGIADWDNNIQRLRASRPLEYLNFELSMVSKPNRHENDLYGKLSPSEYFALAYTRACRIAWKYANFPLH